MDTQAAVLYELEPVVAQNLDRHLKMAREWFPHDYVPWSRGRDFAFLGGEDWQPEDSPLDPVAKTALTVNLLTEDNLPSYHREIATRFSRDGAWGTWIGQWTAEEGRHSIALRDYLVVTRGVDPVALERLRMEHTVAGYDAGDRSALSVLAYVSFQELATRVSHRNTGKASGCPLADQLLARIAAERGAAPVVLGEASECLRQIDVLLRVAALDDHAFSSYVILNERFHALLGELSGSAVLTREMERLAGLPFASPSAFVVVQANSPQARDMLIVAQDQHWQVLDAIERREGARAESIMREHSRIAQRNLRDAVQSHDLNQMPGVRLIRKRA